MLLALTPLYELRVAGIFPLMDTLVDVIFSRLPFSNRVFLFFNGIGNFLAKSIGAFQGQMKALIFRNAPNTSLPSIGYGGSSSSKNKKDEQPSQEVSEEPSDDPDRSPLENEYIDKEYQQCIEENYVPVTPDMSTLEVAMTSLKNNSSSITCNIQKLQSYTRLSQM